MALTKRTRFEVLKRDNHACRYCGATAPDATLTVDHVTPVALGGSDDPSNLVAACRDCNAGKSSTAPDAAVVEDVKQDALRWSAAQAQAAKIRLADRKKRDAYVRRFEKAWAAHDFGKNTHPRPPDWKPTLWNFYAAGLPIEEVEDAVTIACSNLRVDLDAVFRYFCGVCYRKLDDINSAAQALIATEGGG